MMNKPTEKGKSYVVAKFIKKTNIWKQRVPRIKPSNRISFQGLATGKAIEKVNKSYFKCVTVMKTVLMLLGKISSFFVRKEPLISNCFLRKYLVSILAAIIYSIRVLANLLIVNKLYCAGLRCASINVPPSSRCGQVNTRKTAHSTSEATYSFLSYLQSSTCNLERICHSSICLS